MKLIIDSKIIFFPLSFFICLLLYFPTFHSEPIWDDYHFIFYNEVISGDGLVLGTILSKFNWALSVLAQKALYVVFDENYFLYHCTNFFLHFVNGLLFFYFLKINNIKTPHWGFLIFLLHPSMIISVSWIIQFKTLLCGFFALISLIALNLSTYFIRNKRRALRAFSFISFLLSLSSKSASIPLYVANFLINNKIKLSKFILVPLLMVSSFVCYKLISSPITQEGIYRAVTSTSTPFSTFEFILLAIPQTLNWYFWQSLIPMESIPVRGALPLLYAQTFVGIFTMITFFILVWKNKKAMRFFGASFIMLLPFIGLIPAPYMSSAWVSEQHLYLVLIFFIPALAILLESIPSLKVRTTAQVLSLIFVGAVNYLSIDNYKDEHQFFKSSFDFNNNLPAGYHLLNHYMANKQIEEARTHFFHLISTIPMEERKNSNIFWAQIMQFEPILNTKQSE